MAIFGTPILPARIIIRGEYVQNVLRIYNAAHNSDNYAAWLTSNPDAADILAHVEQLANGDG